MAWRLAGRNAGDGDKVWPDPVKSSECVIININADAGVNAKCDQAIQRGERGGEPESGRLAISRPTAVLCNRRYI